jgi:hypothetical protein
MDMRTDIIWSSAPLSCSGVRARSRDATKEENASTESGAVTAGIGYLATSLNTLTASSKIAAPVI